MQPWYQASRRRAASLPRGEKRASRTNLLHESHWVWTPLYSAGTVCGGLTGVKNSKKFRRISKKKNLLPVAPVCVPPIRCVHHRKDARSWNRVLEYPQGAGMNAAWSRSLDLSSRLPKVPVGLCDPNDLVVVNVSGYLSYLKWQKNVFFKMTRQYQIIINNLHQLFFL